MTIEPEKLKELTADAEKWDNRELGASEEHLGKLSAKEQRELDEAIDEGLGLQLISIRLNKAVVEDLKILAKEDGLGYQPFIRQILARYVADQKRVRDSARVTARKKAAAPAKFTSSVRSAAVAKKSAPRKRK